jgi:hypothetical protein
MASWKGRTVVTIDDWKGTGDWNLNPTNWSPLGAPPSLTEEAAIESGDCTLSTAGWVDILNIISGARLTLTGAASLTAAGNLNDQGVWAIDASGGSGGGAVKIGGTLTNTGAITIGNSSLSASTTVKASGLVNSGSITVQGNAALGATQQATLYVTGAAPSTLTGSVSLYGDSLLEFGSGGITTIGTGASLALYGAQARVSIGTGATNSALSGLQSNAGTLDLEGDNPNGNGGGSLTTTTGLNNSGTLDVDTLYRIQIMAAAHNT